MIHKKYPQTIHQRSEVGFALLSHIHYNCSPEPTCVFSLLAGTFWIESNFYKNNTVSHLTFQIC